MEACPWCRSKNSFQKDKGGVYLLLNDVIELGRETSSKLRNRPHAHLGWSAEVRNKLLHAHSGQNLQMFLS